MLLKKGKARYRFPRFSQIKVVTVGDLKRMEPVFAVYIVPIDQLALPQAVKPGRPLRCAIYNDIIEFEPTPDKDYKATAIYAPPLMEW